MKRILLGIYLIAFLIVVVLVIAGSMRYGGPDGLLLRVRAELATQQEVEHDLHVPTPLPTPTQPLVQQQSATTPENIAVATHVTATPTTQPTVTTVSSLLPSPTPIHAPASSGKPNAETVMLTGLTHYWQTWNNCGPATLAMQLSYFGSDVKQEAIRRLLRPNKEDKNVSPWELVSFARAQGYNALVRVNGDSERLRLLLSNDIPVLIETWLLPEPNDGMGHYRLLTGYDDTNQTWTTYDSYVSTGVKPNQPYRGVRIPFAEIDRFWPVFNHTYVVIYSDDQVAVVEGILGSDLDDTIMWQDALAAAEAAVSQTPDSAFAWFNLGTDLVALGRYNEAATAYDRSRLLGLPWRMLWYQFGPFKAYYETGRYNEVLSLADATLRTTIHVEELHYWRGKALEAMGDIDTARRAYEKTLKINAYFEDANAALAALKHDT